MDRSILITGASTGIGRATVEAFAAAGWRVAATMRKPEDGEGLAALAGVRVFPLDVTSTASVEAAVAAVHAAFGRIDAVVNNAGYAVDGIFESMDDELIRRQFDTNVFGLMRVTRAVLPLLRRQRGGTLVQVSSTVAVASGPRRRPTVVTTAWCHAARRFRCGAVANAAARQRW